jgi:flagellar hook-associated protein 1 FlgK
MSGNVFAIGLSGLNAARLALSTTGHNITNVGTEGFTRQEIVQKPAVAQNTGAGFIGTGVEVTTVKRLYNQFLEIQRLNAQSEQSYLDTFANQATQIDNLLADPTSGLSPALQGFFTGVADLAANPSSIPSRQSMLSSAESLQSRFQAIDARFTDLRDGVSGQISSTVDLINTLATTIADVNRQLISAGSSQVQPANDLLDHRGQLVTQLNKLIKTSTVTQADGSFNVFIGNGQSLVAGDRVMRLSAEASAEDPDAVDITLSMGQGTSVLPPDVIQGGELGALVTFRDGLLTDTQNGFGRVALALATSFNTQHRLGQDLTGLLGGDFFIAPVPVVSPGADNTGDGFITTSVSDITGVTNSDYRLTFAGGNFTVTRISDGNQTVSATLPQVVDGLTIDLASGTPQDGDSYLIMPTRYSARDLRVGVHDTAKIAAAAPVRTAAPVTNGGNAKISAGVVTSVADIPLPAGVTLTYTAATNEFNVSGAVPAAGPFTYTEGSTISFNGISFSITGTPVEGDTFTITNNTAGVADNRNALALSRLQTRNIIGGTANYQGSYSQMVSDVGNTTQELQVQLKAQDTLTRQTVEAEQSFSGVNLDEEAANLIRNQQAYQASAKVLQIASSLFQSVLELG